MINSYVAILEEIVLEMSTALSSGSKSVSDAEYLPWAQFLKQVHPGSHIFKEKKREAVTTLESQVTESVSIDTNFNKELKQFFDLREIMILAETNQYPIWFIQPKFNKELLVEYENGGLKNTSVKRNGTWEKIGEHEEYGVPKDIKEFTGKIIGTWSENQQFIACDVEGDLEFLEKMELIEKTGLSIAEFVLFPTDKIPTISSNKLATFFQNYLSKSKEQGLVVDGAVVISDTPLVVGDDHISSNRIVFKPG